MEKSAELDDADGDGLADAGEEITYSFAVTNTGNVTLTGIGVDDAMVGDVTCAATELAPTEQTTCTADEPYVTTQADVDSGSVDNSATASGTPPGEDTHPVVSDPATTSTPTPAPAPAVTVVKVAELVDEDDDGLAAAGEQIIYSFTVTNTGNQTLTEVTVVDPKVEGLTCESATLALGEETTCSAAPYEVTADDVTAGEVANTATATAQPPGEGTPPVEAPEGPVSREPTDLGGRPAPPTSIPTGQAPVRLVLPLGALVIALGAAVLGLSLRRRRPDHG